LTKKGFSIGQQNQRNETDKENCKVRFCPGFGEHVALCHSERAEKDSASGKISRLSDVDALGIHLNGKENGRIPALEATE